MSVVLDLAGITVLCGITLVASGPASEHSRSAWDCSNQERQSDGTSEVQTLEKADAILRTWTRRQNQAAVRMAIPLVVGFVVMTFFPSAFSDIVLAVAPVISLTTGIFMIPEDFRSRRGSLVSAFCLVAAMWVFALIVALVRLLG